MRIQRFSILMIFFSETYPENVQNNFMKNPANCVREFNAFFILSIFFADFFPEHFLNDFSTNLATVQNNSTLFHPDDIFWKIYPIHPTKQKSGIVENCCWDILFISSLLIFRRKKCNVEKHSFWWLFRNPSQPSRRLSNDLYIESATTDAISDLFQNWTFPFFISGWIETSKSDQYSCPFNFGPNVVREHIYHSTDSWGKKSVC